MKKVSMIEHSRLKAEELSNIKGGGVEGGSEGDTVKCPCICAGDCECAADTGTDNAHRVLNEKQTSPQD